MTELQKAYKMVLEDMIKGGCGLLVGRYDAVNGSREFMYGINTVMEYIAYNVDDETGDRISDMFVDNLIASEREVEE